MRWSESLRRVDESVLAVPKDSDRWGCWYGGRRGGDGRESEVCANRWDDMRNSMVNHTLLVSSDMMNVWLTMLLCISVAIYATLITTFDPFYAG